MSLNLRFLFFSCCLILASSVAAWSSVSSLAEDIIEEWAVRYAEKQVLYDRQRTLQPLIRELALSRQFAHSPAILAFAKNPQDADLRKQALLEMENFRFNFLEMNYFVALLQSGEYFHNDANNTYQGRQLRYVLRPDNSNDAWFYEQIRQKRALHVNVNWDAELDVTKLWIDILLQDGDEVLGIVGTGLNLNAILGKIVQKTDVGVTNIFVDHSGAIQLYHDTNLINYSTISKPENKLHRVSQLIDNPDDRALLKSAMESAFQSQDQVVSHYIQIAGRRNLMAAAYLPEIDWYEITLIDIDTFLPVSRFTGIFIVYSITLVALIVLLNLVLRYLVIRPLRQLNKAMDQVKSGLPVSSSLTGYGEIGSLMQHFREMATAVARSQAELEQQVQERTRELELATRTDPLTQLFNRRGMLQILESRTLQPRQPFSLIWLDLDFFKEINDRYGHHQGDKALIAVADIMKKHIDHADIGASARWGGDELLGFLTHTQPYQVLAVAEAIRLEIERFTPEYAQMSAHHIPLTVSVGAYVVRPEDSLNDALNHTDAALYRAKGEGRNLVRLANEPRVSLHT